MADFEQDVIELIELAGGVADNDNLHEELSQRGHNYDRSYLPKKLGKLSSIQQGEERGTWRLIELAQGEGSTADTTEWTRSFITPPVISRTQQLPVDKLSWELFENLCVRLLERQCKVETVQPYGLRGQNQLGIDVFGLGEDGNYIVVQCKRYQGGFTPSHMTEAVDRFLKGSWSKRATRLILAVTQSVTETGLAEQVVSERKRLEDHEFVVWDSEKLSILLKEAPNLVRDFFGEAWVKVFCDPDTRPHTFLLDATSNLAAASSTQDPRRFEEAVRSNGYLVEGSIRKAQIADVTGFQETSLWETARKSMASRVSTLISIWEEDDPSAAISVFPLARTSLLFCLGQDLGDQRKVELYRWERDEHHWRWKEIDEDDGLKIISPEEPAPSRTHVALLISLSFHVDRSGVEHGIHEAFGAVEYDIWELAAADERRTVNELHHPHQLIRFQKKYRTLLRDIDKRYGNRGVDLHIFIAAAAPFAVAMGQEHLTKARPQAIHLYEYDGVHHLVLTV